jgi:hypothetical protein
MAKKLWIIATSGYWPQNWPKIMNWTNRVWDCHVTLSCYLGNWINGLDGCGFSKVWTSDEWRTVRMLFLFFGCKVNRPVTEHLSAKGRTDSREGLHCFWYPNQTWTPSLGASDTLIIVENELKMRKLQPPKVQGVKNSKKNKPSNITKAGSQTSKKFLVCRSVVIRAQRWLVELQVAVKLSICWG